MEWQPIADMPDVMKDGRPVLLWLDWSSARERYSNSDGTWDDKPVTARWCRPGGYWALTEAGGWAEDDEVCGQPSHWAEIVSPMQKRGKK